MVDLACEGQLRRSLKHSAPQNEPPPLSLSPFLFSFVHTLCAGACLSYSFWLAVALSGQVWERACRTPLPFQGSSPTPPTWALLTWPMDTVMIYNLFQEIIAANGPSQFVLPNGGGQNQLMESLIWPGLMAQCGLTSGSDKGLSDAGLIRRLEEKEEKHIPTPTINFMYNGQRV